MSRLTNCCACNQGCEPEQLYWVEPGANAQASKPEEGIPTGPAGCVEVHDFYLYGTNQDYHYLRDGCQQALVTTETEKDTLVLDVHVDNEVYDLSPYGQFVDSFRAQLKLWCDEFGANEALSVTIRGERGPEITFLTEDPKSFQLALLQPAFFGQKRRFAEYLVFVDLEVNGQTQTVQLIAPAAGGNPNGFLDQQVYERYVRNLHLRVVATHADGDCDVYVSSSSLGAQDAMFDDGSYIGNSRGYEDGYSESGGLVQVALSSPDALAMEECGHIFQTQQIVKQHKRVAALLTTASEQDVYCRAKAYSPSQAPAAPAYPEDGDTECFCTPTGATGPADCYVDRSPGAGSFTPANPYAYPWFLSPCVHVRRGSRVSHGKESGNFSGLRVTIPSLTPTFYPPTFPTEVIGYTQNLPPGPFELIGERSGEGENSIELGGNNFWLSVGEIDDIVVPDGFGQGVPATFKTYSMTLAAQLRTSLWRPSASGAQANILIPCEGDISDWETWATVYIYLRGRLFQGNNPFWNFSLWITLTSKVGSALHRGDEVGQIAGSRSRMFLLRRDPVPPFTLPYTDQDVELSYSEPVKLQLFVDE